MTARLLPYDAIKQNNPCAFAHAFREPSARLRRAAPLRVNDVTIMSPSRIITIAADTDLYNFERNPTESRQGAAAISSGIDLPKLHVVSSSRVISQNPGNQE